MFERQILEFRSRAGVYALDLARRLLDIKPSDGDFDTCVFCQAKGCVDGTAEHRPDCPSQTNVYPVQLHDMWPGGPSLCEGCGTKLWPGSTFSHVPHRDGDGNPLDVGGIPIYEIRCVGCQVLEGVNAG